jgi:hypothetical protein
MKMDQTPETLKLLEGNTGGSLQDTEIGNDFLNRTAVSQEK